MVVEAGAFTTFNYFGKELNYRGFEGCRPIADMWD